MVETKKSLLSLRDMETILALNKKKEKLVVEISYLEKSLEKNRYNLSCELSFVAPLCYGEDDKKKFHFVPNEKVVKEIIRQLEEEILDIEERLEEFEYNKEN